ncbi:MAG TPA: TetR/AcrR family transcriptional regulator [Candidatus Stackebrandtia excrementipullorum]|nr:TetR/AcrR family transcriptional regulator [Candidatus Stackebrandtia excrementipullorum]
MTRQTGTLEPARRRKLLASAAAEFIEFGYQKASLNRIIGMHRMSKSSFYHYFESKAALFDAVVDEAAARLSEQLIVPRPADLAGPHYWDRIEAAVDRLARMRDESVLGLAWLFYLPDAPQGGAPDRIRGAIDRWIDAALMAGRVCGAVRDDLPATLQARMVTAVLWAMDEWTVSHMTEADARQVADLGASQVDAVRRLLAP